METDESCCQWIAVNVAVVNEHKGTNKAYKYTNSKKARLLPPDLGGTRAMTKIENTNYRNAEVYAGQSESTKL
jgi:hypothetical protein